MKVKVTDFKDDCTGFDLVRERNLKKMKGYKLRGYTALQLINTKKFPKVFVESNFDYL